MNAVTKQNKSGKIPDTENNTKTDTKSDTGGENPLTKFLKTTDPTISFIRDILCVVCIVGLIVLGLYAVCGTWPAVVAIESESMVPNMNVGDLVIVVAPDRFGNVVTSEEGAVTGYGKYNGNPDKQGNKVYGDVIVYKPNGLNNLHPIIHRAISWHDADASKPSDVSGYITKGDNNNVYDQMAGLTNVGMIQPVKKEWVVGKAFFSIPYVGYAPLHIVEFAIILIVIMVIHELYIRNRDENRGKDLRTDTKNNQKSNKGRKGPGKD